MLIIRFKKCKIARKDCIRPVNVAFFTIQLLMDSKINQESDDAPR